MEASAAPAAASKGTQRVHWIGEAQSDEEQRASQIRSRKSTGDTPEDLSPPASIDAPRKRQKRGVKGVGNDGKGGTSGLEVAARKSTHEGAQEVVAEQGASARAIESCEPFPAIRERIPEKVQRPFPRPSKEQIDAIIEEAFSAHGRHNGATVGCGSPIYQP